MHLKKKNGLATVLKLSGENWRQTKYAYGVSSLKTAIFRIKECISKCLQTIDNLGKICAEINGVSHLYKQGSKVDLNEQENYVCIKKMLNNTTDESTRYIKQRTQAWHTIRNRAKVTGSTMHTALGLGTLKTQQQHFDNVYNGVKKPEFSSNQKAAMLHGVNNEINAIGTLVSKVLPIYNPNLTFFEEGCIILQSDINEDEHFMVVSPDGSGFDNVQNKTALAFEIKCPTTKQFTVDLHYKIPYYYICQLLCEMYALESVELYYACYTYESTVVHKVSFDLNLWKILWKKIQQLYPNENPIRPKKTDADKKEMLSAIKRFAEENSIILGEFKSVIAEECKHSVIGEIHGKHKAPLDVVSTCNKVKVLEAQEYVIKVIACCLNLFTV